MTSPHHGRHPVAKSRNPFTCGLTGKTFTHDEFNQRREALARAVAKRMGWQPNEETEWDKVACIFSVNTVSTYLITPNHRTRDTPERTPRNEINPIPR